MSFEASEIKIYTPYILDNYSHLIKIEINVWVLSKIYKEGALPKSLVLFLLILVQMLSLRQPSRIVSSRLQIPAKLGTKKKTMEGNRWRWLGYLLGGKGMDTRSHGPRPYESHSKS